MSLQEKVPTATRWERAVGAAAEAGVDALYVAAGPNFKWLTGRSPYTGGLPIWLSALIVPIDGPGVGVISTMHAEIFDLGAAGVGEVVTYEDGDDPIRVLKDALRAAGLGEKSCLGVEDNLPFGDISALNVAGPSLQLQSAQAVFDRLRSVKDEAELKLLRASGRAVDAAYQAIQDSGHPGSTMSELGVAMYRAMLDAGAELPRVGGAFKRYTDRDIAVGTFIDADLGADVGDYSVDTARNVFVGEPGPELRSWYSALEEAYDASVAAAKPGSPVEEVHKACAEAVAKTGHRQSWKVGHGVGLAPSHEAPLLQPGNPVVLEENMVFTIDPGFFVEQDEPLHIEETVVVTADGCERLTNFPLQMLVI